jgi:transglutaminase-like putative cysteine protease
VTERKSDAAARAWWRDPRGLAGSRRASLGPGSFFYTIRSDDEAIGIASSRLDTLPDGFIYDDLLTLDVPALDSVHRATVRTELALDEALTVRGFAFDLDSEIGRFSATGEAGEDGVLALTIDDGSGSGRAHRLPADVLLPSALTLRLAASGRLEVGAELNARVFDPSVMDTRDVRLVVTARDTVLVPDSVTWQTDTETWRIETYDTVPAWTIEQEFAGVRVRSRVDAEGRLVAAGYGSIIESTAIATGVLDEARARDRLAVRLLNVGLEGFDLAGGRQALAGDTLRVTREALGADAGWALPWTAPPGIPPADLAGSLAATPLVQSDDPRIMEAARAIVGGETDPTAVARLLNRWVYDTLEKNVTLSLPSALQVLAAREGDCNEHTVLYVALARSLGLPARTAAGLVHVGERFYYHAWPEVWLDDRWVAVDPTLGQFPADASHLRFLVGGLARQVELLRLIGRLRLEVVT